MAENGRPGNSFQTHTFPQSKYIDAVRWLPPLSAFDRFSTLALFDSDSCTSSIEIYALPRSYLNPPNLIIQSSFDSPSRISFLTVSQPPHMPMIVASTFSGSIQALFLDSIDYSIKHEISVGGDLHSGPVTCIDMYGGVGESVLSVGEEGRINLVRVGDSDMDFRRVFDSFGLVSYSAVKWASPTEFATGGLGFSLQWWDLRKPGTASTQFKGNWAQGTASGFVHSIDIHMSRKHTCLAGGSLGTLFAWDIRWPQQPIILSGPGISNSSSESEIWEIQYDPYTSSKPGNFSSSQILPVMICSEDGILAVVKQDEEPTELLAEHCAINCFDIDKQNPSDVICATEWESIAILTRL